MVTTVRSLGLTGIAGYEVAAECFLSGGLPAFDIVGLPDAAVREARERVRAAVKNCGAKFPVSRITVNLAPAGTKKAGTVYDLPIFVGPAGGRRQNCPRRPRTLPFIGELSLTGALRGVTGVLPMALAARDAGIRTLYRPGGQRRRSNAGGGIDGLRRAGRGRPGGPSEKRGPSDPRPGLDYRQPEETEPAGLAGRDGTGECKAGTGDRRGRRT